MVFQLVMLNGPKPGATIPIDPASTTITIGRDATRDLPIDDNLVSRLHARLCHDGRGWQIEDCQSLNGTHVNSQPIDRTVLESGDRIRIGDRVFMFLRDASSVGSSDNKARIFSESTRLIRITKSATDSSLFGVDSHSVSGPLRNFSLLCDLLTTMQTQGTVDSLTGLICRNLEKAIGARIINIWLARTDGRLRRVSGIPDKNPFEDHENVLPSVVMEKDEGLLMTPEQLGSSPSGENRDQAGSILVVPIPGQKRPRGAVECHQASQPEGFRRDDLDYAHAVAHQFGMAIENLEYRERLEQSNEQLRRSVSKQTRLLGTCVEIGKLQEQISRVAPTSSTVMVLGESGTGKELVSRSIHELSQRVSGPFVAVNCAAFNESLLESELFGHEAGAFTGADQRRLGQFERAHRGTIFLDEVAEMSPACQAKLLRLLEGHPFHRLGGNEAISVDVRVVAATHCDLQEMVRKNQFREDLFYRLRVIELSLPPLRERGDDILELAAIFLDQFRRELGRGPVRFSRDAAEKMMSYGWPGNVRELRNAVERAVVLCAEDEILPADLGLPSGNDESREDLRLMSLEQAELRHIEYVLRAVGGNKTRACEILDIGRGTLYKKLDLLKARQQSVG